MVRPVPPHTRAAILCALLFAAVLYAASSAIAQRLNREIDTVVRSGEFTRRVAEFGWANRNGARTPQETAEYIRAQRERWSKVVKDLGLQAK